MAGSVTTRFTENYLPELIRLYVHEKKSLPQIAEILSVPPSTARDQLVAAGVKMRTRIEGIRLRGDVLGLQSRGHTRTMTPEWRANISAARRSWAEKHAIGTRVTSKGYVEYTRGEHKGRLVHVVMMETRLGRPLLPDEIVHHVDEDRQNNSWDNLCLMTKAAHSRHHRRLQRLTGGSK